MLPSAESQKHNEAKGFSYFLTYGIGLMSIGLAMASLGPLLPYLAENVGVTLAQISFLFTASNFGYLTGSTGGGRLFDRFKGHRLMILALVMMIIMSVLIPIIPGFFLLLTVMYFFGIGQGLLDVGGNVNLLWIYQSRVGPYMSALHFCYGLGAFLSPIVIFNVMRLSGGVITWPYWILAILFIPSLFGLWFLQSPENPEKGGKSQTKQASSSTMIVLMMLLFFTSVGIQIGFGGWIFTYAVELKIVNEASASYINSAFWGAITLGRLLTIPIAKKVSPSTILYGNILLSIVFLGGILIWPRSILAIWICSIGLGLSLSSIFPTLLSLGESRMKITGAVTGLFYLGSSLGSMLLPMLLGQIFEFIGSYHMMLTMFGTACIGLVILISLIRSSHRGSNYVEKN